MRNTTLYPAAPNAEPGEIQPFLINRKYLFTLFSSPRLAQRMIAAGWIAVVRRGTPGREALYSYESAKAAFERFKGGEEPPLLPSEKRKK